MISEHDISIDRFFNIGSPINLGKGFLPVFDGMSFFIGQEIRCQEKLVAADSGAEINNFIMVAEFGKTQVAVDCEEHVAGGF